MPLFLIKLHPLGIAICPYVQWPAYNNPGMSLPVRCYYIFHRGDQDAYILLKFCKGTPICIDSQSLLLRKWNKLKKKGPLDLINCYLQLIRYVESIACFEPHPCLLVSLGTQVHFNWFHFGPGTYWTPAWPL